MKLVYNDMGHILRFDGGYVNELVVENKKLFWNMVESAAMQADGSHGKFLLSIADRPVEFHRYADVTVQFAPFQVNRKNLLTKLYSALERNAQAADNYLRTAEILGEIERYILYLAEDLPLELNCSRLAMGAIIKAAAPEVDDSSRGTLEKIFDYMQLVRELDRDRLFIMVNMRTFFSDEDMERFTESACLHDNKVLLLEGSAQAKLKNTKRYTIDADLCEF